MPHLVYSLPLLTRSGANNGSLLCSLKVIKEIESREGSVEICKQKKIGKLYVVKSVRQSSKSTPPNEANILGALPESHSNVIVILAAELTRAGRARMVFEYCNGGDLAVDIARHRGELPTVLGLHVAVSIADALAFIHHGLINTSSSSGRRYEKIPGHQAIIHCDIKEDNVFLRTPGRIPGLPDIVLADFGCAILLGQEVTRFCTHYRAPELSSSNKKPTPKTDCYSYGVMLYEMARGGGGEWKTGRDPESIDLKGEERGVWKPLLTAVLRADPKVRKDMSANPAHGALSIVAKMREARDAMLYGEQPRRQEGPHRAKSYVEPQRRRSKAHRTDERGDGPQRARSHRQQINTGDSHATVHRDNCDRFPPAADARWRMRIERRRAYHARPPCQNRSSIEYHEELKSLLR